MALKICLATTTLDKPALLDWLNLILNLNQGPYQLSWTLTFRVITPQLVPQLWPSIWSSTWSSTCSSTWSLNLVKQIGPSTWSLNLVFKVRRVDNEKMGMTRWQWEDIWWHGDDQWWEDDNENDKIWSNKTGSDKTGNTPLYSNSWPYMKANLIDLSDLVTSNYIMSLLHSYAS